MVIRLRRNSFRSTGPREQGRSCDHDENRNDTARPGRTQPEWLNILSGPFHRPFSNWLERTLAMGGVQPVQSGTSSALSFTELDMSDFHQNGVVTVLHRLGQPNV